MKKFFLFLGVVFPSCLSSVQFWELSSDYSKSILNKMSLREKVGQLVIPSAVSYDSYIDRKLMERLIQEYKIGGIMFMYGSPKRQIKLVNNYQNLSKIPLLISQDCEWGFSMRLKDTITFPKNLTLGALSFEDGNLIYLLGKEIGRQSLLLGVKVCFAPVVDVNNDPENPIIGIRSFGEEPGLVAKKALLFMNGVQSQGVMACAKHFPGHGNVKKNSHDVLPVVPSSLGQLKRTELYPFKKLFDAGVGSIMVAHLLVPALDKELSSSLSSKIVTNLLQDKMGFKGLIFTDGLKMGAVSNSYDAAELALKVFLAGNDLFLFCDNFLFAFGEAHSQETFDQASRAVESLESVIRGNKQLEFLLDKKVLKVLKAKQALGLFENKFVNENISNEEFNSSYAKKLKQKIFDRAVTLVKNEDDLIDLNKLKDKNCAAVFIGADEKYFLSKFLYKFGIKEQFFIGSGSFAYKSLIDNLKENSSVIVSVYLAGRYNNDFSGITNEILQLLKDLKKEKKNILLILFGTPYALKFFKNERNILVAYENEPEAEKTVIKILLREINSKGKLPVTCY